MRSALSPETFAVDLADHLAARGVPFRQAHEFVGQAILRAESLGVGLDQMRPEDWQAVSLLFGEEMAGLFDVGRALDRRAASGGTAAAALQTQAGAAQGWLASRGRPAV